MLTPKQYGVYLHELRTHINQALETKAKQLATAAMNAKLASEQIDIGLPARGILSGGLHPITQTTERMKQFLFKLVLAWRQALRLRAIIIILKRSISQAIILRVRCMIHFILMHIIFAAYTHFKCADSHDGKQ